MPLRHHLALAGRGISSVVRPNVGRVSATLAVALLVSAAAASEPLLLKAVVDRLATVHPDPRGASGAALDAVVAAVATFATVLACRILGAALVTTSTWAVRLNIEYQLRSRVAAKLSVLSARTQSAIGTGGLRYAIG